MAKSTKQERDDALRGYDVRLGGTLIFPSDAAKEAYLEQAVRTRAQELLQEKIRDHTRSIPGLTPEREAQEWAEITLALATVTSRKEVGRKRKGGAHDF